MAGVAVLFGLCITRARNAASALSVDSGFYAAQGGWLLAQSNGHPSTSFTNELSVRDYYFNYRGGDFRENVLFRIDSKLAHDLSMTAQMVLASRYKDGVYTVGSGDAFAQIRYSALKTSQFGLTLGAATIIPTASASNLGSGKFQLAPIVMPIFYPLGDDHLSLALQLRNFISVVTVEHSQFISVEGDALFSEPEGGEINFLEVRPAIRYVSERWELTGEPVLMTVNWEDGNALSYRSALRIARAISEHVEGWIQPEVPFGSDRTGYFNLKLSLSYRF